MVSLPQGWIELVDPGSGKPYYFHAEKNTTSWEKPSSASNDDSNNNGSSSAANTNNNTTLPLGWTQHKDPRSGKTYYYNSQTNTTSWKHPSESSSSSSSFRRSVSSSKEEERRSTQEKEGDDDDDDSLLLPPGWVKHFDPKHGKPYYFSAEQNITSWKHPSLSETTKRKSKKTTKPKQKRVSSSSSSSFQPIQTPSIRDLKEKQQQQERETDVNSNSLLPAGWYELVEESSGRTYYYNRETNTSSWEKPVAATTEEPSSSSPPSTQQPSTLRSSNGNIVPEQSASPSSNNNDSGAPVADTAAAAATADVAVVDTDDAANTTTAENNNNGTKKKKKKGGPTTPLGCYLVYESHSGGRLILQYTREGDDVPANPVGMFIPGEGHTIPKFKFTQHNGKTELIKGIAGGDQNRRKYYAGWCQFIKLARSMSGLVIQFPPVQGVHVDVYGHRGSDMTSHILELDEGFKEVLEYDMVAVMPRNYEFLRGVKKVLPNYFLDKGNKAGATTIF